MLRDAWVIAARDSREFWRDGRFRWAAALLTTVLIVAALSGWADTREMWRLHAEAQAAERELSLDKGEMNPHAAAHYGAFVFKPVEPLASIDPGVTPFVGVTLFLEAHQQHLARHRPAADQTAAQRLGELSLASAFQTLVPLLIVTLAHAAFAGERERGTLKLVSSLGVTRTSLMLGKAMGTVLPLLTVLLPAALIGVIAMARLQPGGLDVDAVWRAAVLSAVYLAYFGLWTACALTVSALARSSGSALMTLLSLWFAACLVLPPVAAAIAQWQYPAPGSAELALALQRGHDDLPAWNDRVAEVEQRFLSGALPMTPDMPSNPEVVALVDAERDESALYDARFASLQRDYVRQSAAYERLSWIAPTVAVRSLSMALAGTDYAFHQRFLEAATAYRAQFLALLNAELVAYTEANTFDYTRGRELWERIPEFAFAPPDVWSTLAGQRQNLAALAAWCLLSTVALGAAVARMAVA